MKLLSLTVRATVILLTAGAFLVVLGIFDDLLDWDIFSPEVETLLRGVFAACVSLGGFGALICVVLGIQEVVHAFRKLVARDEAPREAPRRTYTVALAAVLVVLIATVAALGAVNRRVEAHRLKVFKLIAQDQMNQLGPHLAAEVSRLPAPCATCATPAMEQFFVTLLGLSFCRSATLYLPDPANDTVLWRYPEEDPRYSSDPPGIERFFIAKDDDRAIHLALHGDTAWIDQKNAGPGFVWHHVIKDGQGKIRAVLQIWGNESESFREYQAVAAAAAKKGGPK
jgi:hypothetical protein